MQHMPNKFPLHRVTLLKNVNVVGKKLQCQSVAQVLENTPDLTQN